MTKGLADRDTKITMGTPKQENLQSTTKYFWPIFVSVALLILVACSPKHVSDQNASQNALPPVTSTKTEYAVNIGGGKFRAIGGTLYQSDNEWVTGGVHGKVDDVLGTQNTALFTSYRKGNVKIDVPLPNGRYDVTLHFTEPENLAVGERVFDIIIEDKIVISDFDIRHRRDGNVSAALTYTFPKIVVNDGQINVRFKSLKREPVISGLVVRAHQNVDTVQYKLKWADEFNQNGHPDIARWRVKLWRPRRVNREDQVYSDRAKNLRVEDGKLIIEAHKEDYRGGHYSSARLTSEGSGDILYGRVEVRAKIPIGGGTWPAIWMYPTDRWRYSGGCDTKTDSVETKGCVAWPHSGEIDIMEHVGNDPGVVLGTVHTKAYYWVNGQQRKGAVVLDNLENDFHEYAINWTPDRMDMFVDDTLYYSYLREQDADWRAWPFDHPYHIILNLAIGGSWGSAGGGIDDSIFPQQLEVDYVRVYDWTKKGTGE